MRKFISTPGKSMMFVILTLVFAWSVSVADAQRGQPMRGPQNQAQPQPWAGEWDRYDPGMMQGRGMPCPFMGPGMMGPGMGMMGPGMGMMSPGMGMMGFMHLPDLTEEQQNEIRSIIREVRREHMEVMADIMDMRDDMMAEMSAERPDPEKVRELHNALSQKQGALLESAIENRNRIHEVLTEEQRERLKEMQQQPFGRPDGPRWDR